jgi:hypothetical protein
MPLRSQEVTATILETVRAHCQSPLAENVVFAKILFEKATYYQILPFLRGAINYVKTGTWGPR